MSIHKGKDIKENGMCKSVHANYDIRAKIAIGIIFAVATWLFLYLCQSDYLFTAQEHSLWLNSKQFFTEKMAVAGGFLQWLGCWFTQFFYRPALGSMILVALWLLIYAFTLSAFKTKGKWAILALLPCVLLLCSIIDLGYWLYYIKIPGYWFSETLGYLALTISVWISTRLRGIARPLWIVLFCIAGYPLFGWYSLLATLVMAFPLLPCKHYNKAIEICLAVIAIIGTPILWYQHYTQMRLQDGWTAGFPLFQSNDVSSPMMSIPFALLALSPFILAIPAFRGNRQEEGEDKESNKPRIKDYAIEIAIGLAYCIMVWCAWFKNDNYRDELRMMHALDNNHWNEIINISSRSKGLPTRQMLLIRNLALLNTNSIGDQMFKFTNESQMPVTRDSLRVRMSRTAAPTLYYRYGKTYFSYRWCIENAVEYGMNVKYLKLLAKNSIINREPAVAVKYINLLKRTTFHKKEAARLEAFLINPMQKGYDEEMKSVINLIDTNDMLDTDDGMCDIYLTEYLSHITSRNPVFADLIVANTLFVKDNELFWPRFVNYGILHQGQPIPLHYQEAAFMFGNFDKNPIFNDIQFDMNDIIQRYSNFQLMLYNLKDKESDEKAIGEAMKEKYGNTYWWYYYFAKENAFY